MNRATAGRGYEGWVSFLLAAGVMGTLLLGSAHMVLWDFGDFQDRVRRLFSVDITPTETVPLSAKQARISESDGVARVMDAGDAPLFGQQHGKPADAPRPFLQETTPAMPVLEGIASFHAAETWVTPPAHRAQEQAFREQQVRASVPPATRPLRRPEPSRAGDALQAGAFLLSRQPAQADRPGSGTGGQAAGSLFDRNPPPPPPSVEEVPRPGAPAAVLPIPTLPVKMARELAMPPTPPPLPSLDRNILSRIEAYHHPGERDVFFRITLSEAPNHPLPVLPRDVLFLIDVSQSIPRNQVAVTRDAVVRHLGTLTPADRWNVILFSLQHVSFHPDHAFRPLDPERLPWLASFIERRTDIGRTTNVYGAVQVILETIPRSPRPTAVFLLSDGEANHGPTGVRQIVKDFHRIRRETHSIFTYDIAQPGHHALLELLAYRSRGAFGHSPTLEAAPAGLEAFLNRFRRPVLTGCVVNYTKIDPENVFPSVLPDLYRDEPLVFHGKAQPEETVAFRLVGRGADGARMEYFFEDTVPEGTDGDPAIRQAWAEWKARALLSALVDHPGKRELREGLLAHLRTYGLPEAIWLPLLPGE